MSPRADADKMMTMWGLSMGTRLVLLLALATTAGACASGSGGPRPQPFPSVGPPSAVSDAIATVQAKAIVARALTLRGVPYRNGGSDPSGFDCSGFTQYVFEQHGITLPREVRDQFARGLPVRGPRAAGDLVFFATTSKRASHVGILLNDDEFVHAPSSRGVVRIERVSTEYWARRLIGFRRVMANAVDAAPLPPDSIAVAATHPSPQQP
jgi:cell wall-associated NlpC family hydrolase